MEFEIKSPTRIDLSGGTLDCWPLYNFVGPCWTINLSISTYTGVKLKIRKDNKIVIKINDLNYVGEFANINDFLNCSDKELGLILATLKYWPIDTGFEWETYSQSPVGGGLGGSSSLVVSMLKAFGEYFGKKWDLNEIVTVGHNIEAGFLKTPTGTQDYVPAAQPGLNIIEYNSNGFNVEAVDYDADYFSDRMLVVFTGKSHHSGINNWQVVKGAVDGDIITLAALRDVADISRDMRTVCLEQSWQNLPGLFKREYTARIKLSSSFSSPEILKLEEIALRNGAEAVKICGAGGGGCVMIWCPPEKRAIIKETIYGQGYQMLESAPLKKQLL